MADVMILHLDDSGTRNPDRHPGDQLPAYGHDWFGLGGVILREDEQVGVRELHAELCRKWGIVDPLHSCEIRAKSRKFRWLKDLDAERLKTFYEDIANLVTSPHLTAIACVVDRPGYNDRYRDKYGRKRWSLCKTAFTVVVERAAKFSRRHNCRLRVHVERCDKSTDARLRRYYDELVTMGHPFDANNAAKYEPLTAPELKSTLLEFRTKRKTSPLIQIADLCLWPMCIGGYDLNNRSFATLRDAGTLIDSKLPDGCAAAEGIKYSCWELVGAKSPAAQDPPKNQSPA
jgi:hypothetical protein